MKKIAMTDPPKTTIFPVTLKIIIVFTIFILLSNISTNYINLMFNRSALLKLTKQLLVKDMKSINDFANTQYEIFDYNGDIKSSVRALEEKSLREIRNSKAVVLGIKHDGTLFFDASRIKKTNVFNDAATLNFLEDNKKKNVVEGFLNFHFNNELYFGVYKYQPKWDIFILRAEEDKEFSSESARIFKDISIIILILTIVSVGVGIWILRFILRFIQILSRKITKMIQTQQLELVDLKGAPNDDITFLGVAFNSLSNTVDNLINIFRKFVNRDIAMQAYQEREVRLEGTVQELTILFSDIKGFTFITETLGADIIKLLNIHYDRAIREVLDRDGIIGSIIGDAILAVFGVLKTQGQNKSHQAMLSAYKVQEVCEKLRDTMRQRKTDIEKRRVRFSKAEEQVYQAVLLEIGVGIDGGEVFYGNIGSNVRMTNTVIGDNVNSASRLEGLTRIYKLPVICSEYVKEDIEKNVKDHGYHFLKIDMVQVKGKTIGKTIYWPMTKEIYAKQSKKDLAEYTEGLNLYFKGDWPEAYGHFSRCKLPTAEVFRERTHGSRSPKGWNGIWTMKTK
jgi:adenylate cyclase